MTVVFGALSLFFACFALPFVAYIFLLTCSAFSVKFKSSSPSLKKGTPRFWFVIPAHDEESGIARTVKSCLGADYPAQLFQVHVIADNCSDATAQVARTAGAQVFERSHPTKRSKGYALEEFFEKMLFSSLNSLPHPDAVVIVDADTLVSPNILKVFSEEIAQGHRWIQSYYTVSNPEASWRTRLLTFAYALFNGVWCLGQDRLKLGSALRGNGMCCMVTALREHPWQAYGLAEDLEFSWRLRLAGERVHFTARTRVQGDMVSHGQAAASQRKRWETGRRQLQNQFSEAVRCTNRFGFFKKTLLLLDLFSPPLGGLALRLAGMVGFGMAGVGAATHPQPGLWLLSFACAFAAFSLFLYCMSPFVLLDLPKRFLFSLASAPIYFAWKAFVVSQRGPQGWVRTTRETERTLASANATLARPQLAEKLRIGNAVVDRLTFHEALDTIVHLAKEGRSHAIFTPNADHVVRLNHDKLFLEAYRGASLSLPDGMPLIWASKALGTPLKERVTGADLLPALCSKAPQHKLKVFFLGAPPGVAARAAENLSKTNPGLQVAGTYSPPFGFENSEQENEKVIEILQKASPDIVFVGLGSPKQEIWIHHNSQRVSHGVFLGIGAAIAFAAGTEKRAPLFWQKAGLEWLYRLLHNPRYLVRRYLKDVVFFLIAFRTWREQKEQLSTDSLTSPLP